MLENSDVLWKHLWFVGYSGEKEGTKCPSKNLQHHKLIKLHMFSQSGDLNHMQGLSGPFLSPLNGPIPNLKMWFFPNGRLKIANKNFLTKKMCRWVFFMDERSYKSTCSYVSGTFICIFQVKSVPKWQFRQWVFPNFTLCSDSQKTLPCLISQ